MPPISSGRAQMQDLEESGDFEVLSGSSPNPASHVRFTRTGGGDVRVPALNWSDPEKGVGHLEFLSLPVGRLEVVDYRGKLGAGSLEDKLAVQTEDRQCLALHLAAAISFARNWRHQWYRLGSRQQAKDLAQEIR